MKKTFITAALALGLMVPAMADYTLGETNYTTTTGMNASFGAGDCTQFTFTLTDGLFSGSSTNLNAITTASDASTSFTDQLALTSITVIGRNSTATETASVLKIYDSDGALVATSTGVTINNAVAHHDIFDSTKFWTRKSFTWTFDALNSQLEKGETYTAKFLGADGSAYAVGMSLAHNGIGVGGTTAMSTVANTTASTTLSDYQPAGMTIATTSLVAAETPAVPEPATATLSLLALAGLAARRRRK